MLNSGINIDIHYQAKHFSIQKCYLCNVPYSDNIMNTAKTQQTLAFAAMCVDLVAQAEGCSSQEMYQRLKKVGLIHGLTTHLDALHTQSKEYVTNDLLQALHRLEAAQTNKQ